MITGKAHRRFVFWGICLILVLLCACTPDDASTHEAKSLLESFFPPLQKNLRYFGLAEYAHEGYVVKISEDDDKAVYMFKGTFQDGSGIPGNFDVEYHCDFQNGTIQEKVVSNTRSGIAEVNSKMHDPIIIKLPLEVGNTWEQKVMFKGEEKLMRATITSIAYEGTTFYTRMRSGPPVVTIQYIIEDAPGYFENTYVEERRFQEGLGMISFSSLMEGQLDVKDPGNIYLVEQEIINHMFGYGVERQ